MSLSHTSHEVHDVFSPSVNKAAEERDIDLPLAKQSAQRTGDSERTRAQSSPKSGRGFYAAVCAAASAKGAEPVTSEIHVRARRMMWCERSELDTVPVICSGWAAASVTLQTGRRQIVSFLLPGDMVSPTLLFRPQLDCRVESITDVVYRTFDRAQLRSFLFAQGDLFDHFAKAWAEEKSRAERLIVDLGRRAAEERVARLILDLMSRLEERGLIERNARSFEFPLRQHHIADATGLTTVYVSGILTAFRDAGLIEIGGRSLAVVDLDGLRRAALE